MTKCYILGAGASQGYSDNLNGNSIPPGTNEIFSKASQLDLFPQADLYQRLNNNLELYCQENNQTVDQIDVEGFLACVAQRFNDLEITTNIQQTNNLLGTLGEMWYLLFELLKNYSDNYDANSNNYANLARHCINDNCAVISLNYDILFESAILGEGGHFHYPNPTIANTSLPICKIHGSVNWLNPSARGISFGNSTGVRLFRNITQIIFSNRINVENPRIITNLEEMNQLSRNDLVRAGDDYDVPILVPPLGEFKPYDHVQLLIDTWRAAEQIISESNEIVFIGTSLRQQDERLRNMIETNVSDDVAFTIVDHHPNERLDTLRQLLHNDEIDAESFNSFSEYANILSTT